MLRRDALQILSAAAVWPVAGSWLTADLEALGLGVHAELADQELAYQALDASAAVIVAAACERIIPTDETPGALAAGVPRFIDKIMADWETPDYRDRWLAGLATLDPLARAAHQRPFGACTDAEQDALLMALDDEVGALPASERGAHWFARLKYLTVWGYCTSEVGMREELRSYPWPGRYDGNAPYSPRRGSTGHLAGAGRARSRQGDR
jgi:hypothetical protein